MRLRCRVGSRSCSPVRSSGPSGSAATARKSTKTSRSSAPRRSLRRRVETELPRGLSELHGAEIWQRAEAEGDGVRELRQADRGHRLQNLLVTESVGAQPFDVPGAERFRLAIELEREVEQGLVPHREVCVVVVDRDLLRLGSVDLEHADDLAGGGDAVRAQIGGRTDEED